MNDQQKLWNGPSGQAWVEAQAMLDGMYAGIEQLLAAEVASRGARRVLDVGCGTGSTTLAAARAAGPEGRCTGVDISEPMLALARSRAERERAAATFICADAQQHPFTPASFDLVISRFGVMFFDDPVAAFANLRRAAAPRAGLRAIAWRSPRENPFMTAAEQAAQPLLPELPPRQPGAPGQFAFADAARVRSILQQSGWSDADVRPIDVPCVFPEAELQGYAGRLGPVSLALRGADEPLRQKVLEAVRAGYTPWVSGGEVRFIAACWSISATAP